MNDKRQEVGPNFNLDDYLSARVVAKRVALLFAQHIDVGMDEKDGLELLDKLFEIHKIEKKWHPHKFRIGKNTTKAFREKSDLSVKLQENDIYFVDIGPVINGYEADFGMTFTRGQNENYANIQKASRQVFNFCQDEWKENNLTGEELYLKASEFSTQLGYHLNTAMPGHRIGEFPHGLYYKGSLNDFEKTPVKNLWVLEILLTDKSQEFGAFYEDILL